jgi:uncharacterized membrane protein YkoI
MSKTFITGGLVAGLLAIAGTAGFATMQANAETPTLTQAQAVEIALAKVPGEVQETELEREDGVQVYEIEILTADGVEMEVEINADSGEILEIEAEDDYTDKD